MYICKSVLSRGRAAIEAPHQPPRVLRESRINCVMY